MKLILGIIGPWELLILLIPVIILIALVLHKNNKVMSFCPKCGTQITDGTAFCPNCGYRLNDSQSTSTSPSSSASNNACKTCPDNYLVYSILTTLFCCLPFGIVGIVKSAQVSSKYQSGDYEGAVQASRDAKKWSMIALICGLVWCLLYMIVVIVRVVLW